MDREAQILFILKWFLQSSQFLQWSSKMHLQKHEKKERRSDCYKSERTSFPLPDRRLDVTMPKTIKTALNIMFGIILLLAVSTLEAAPTYNVKLQQTLLYKSGVTAVAFSLNGKYLAIGYYSGLVDVRAVRTNGIGHSLFYFNTGVQANTYVPIQAIAFSPDSHTLVVGGEDYLQKWDIIKRRSLWKHRQRNYSLPPKYGRIPVIVSSLAVSPNDDILAGVVVMQGHCGDASEVRLWSNKTGRLKHRLLGYSSDSYGDHPNNVAFLDSQHLLIDDLGLITSCNVYSYKKEWEVKHLNLSNRLVLSPDKHLIICACNEYYEVWDLRKRRLLRRPNIEATFGSECVSISHNSDIVATAGINYTGYRSSEYKSSNPDSIKYQIGLWDIHTGRLIKRLPGSRLVAFSPKSNILLTGESDGIAGLTSKRMRLWKITR